MLATIIDHDGKLFVLNSQDEVKVVIHDDGSLYDIDGNPLGGGGGSQSLQILGPYTVNWDDAGVNSAPIAKANLAVGTTVIRAWGIVTDDWVTDEGDPFQFVLEVGDATDDTATSVEAVDYPSVAGVAFVGDGGAGNPSGYIYRTALVQATGWKLWASVWINGGGALLSGSIDFYALVNVPA